MHHHPNNINIFKIVIIFGFVYLIALLILTVKSRGNGEQFVSQRDHEDHVEEQQPRRAVDAQAAKRDQDTHAHYQASSPKKVLKRIEQPSANDSSHINSYISHVSRLPSFPTTGDILQLCQQSGGRNLDIDKLGRFVIDLDVEVAENKQPEQQETPFRIVKRVPIQHATDYPLPIVLGYNLSSKDEVSRLCNTVPSMRENPSRGHYGAVLIADERKKWPMCHARAQGSIRPAPNAAPAVSSLEGVSSLVGEIQPCSKMANIIEFRDAFVSSNHGEIPGQYTQLVQRYDEQQKKMVDVLQQYILQPYHQTLQPMFVHHVKANPTSIVPRVYEALASPLNMPYPDQHGHFAIESLPHICFLLHEIPEEVPILIASPQLPFIRQFLQRLIEGGWLSEDRIVALKYAPLDVTETYFARKLYVSSSSPNCEDDAQKWYSRELMSLTRKMLLTTKQSHGGHSTVETQSPELPPPPPATRNTIVVIDREDASMRAFSNAAALYEGLSKAFPQEQIVKYVASKEKKGLLHTVSIFEKAKMVIGAHGAGLFNVMFMPPGGTVLEIGFTNGPYPLPSTYYGLAWACQHKYYLSWGVGDLLGPSMVVDVDGLVNTVRAALEDQNRRKEVV